MQVYCVVRIQVYYVALLQVNCVVQSQVYSAMHRVSRYATMTYTILVAHSAASGDPQEACTQRRSRTLLGGFSRGLRTRPLNRRKDAANYCCTALRDARLNDQKDHLPLRKIHVPALHMAQVNGYQTVCQGCFAPFPYMRPPEPSRKALAATTMPESK